MQNSHAAPAPSLGRGLVKGRAQAPQHRVSVLLNNGLSIQVACPRSIRMSDLSRKVWSQVNNTYAAGEFQAGAYFALKLESIGGATPVAHWLAGDMTLSEAEHRYMRRQPSISSWRYRLRMRYFPVNIQEVVTNNEVLANYIFGQLCDDIRRSISLSSETCLRLGALHARRMLANSFSGAFKKSLVESLIHEVGLEHFIPPSLFFHMKPKAVKKQLLQLVKGYASLTQMECLMNYISICYQLSDIVIHDFHCMLEGRSSTVRVCPSRGVVLQSGKDAALQTIVFLSIRYVSMCVTSRGKVEVCIKQEKDTRTTLELSSVSSAYELAILLEGFCRCFSSEICPGPIYTKAEFPDSEALAGKVDARLGFASGAYGPCDARKTVNTKKETITFMVDEDEYSAADDSISRRSTRSSSVRCGKSPPRDYPSRHAVSFRHEKASPVPVRSSRSVESYSDLEENDADIFLVDGAENVPRIRQGQLKVSAVIGEGRFGEVRVGNLNGVQVAIKSMKEGSSAIDKQKFTLEAVIMHEFDHPHIIKMLGVDVGIGKPCSIVMEFAVIGEIRLYLLATEVPVTTLLTFCEQLGSATSYLDSLGFVHRDLAARNVLVCNPKLVKLSDFGLSRLIGDNMYYTASGGALPVKWMAPESINFRRFTSASDVWMFAVCMWEILSCGAKPFIGTKNNDILSQLEDGVRLEKPDKCPDSLYKLFLKCWQFDSHNRPTFAEVHEEISKVVLAAGGERLTVQGEEAPSKRERCSLKERISKITGNFHPHLGLSKVTSSTSECAGASGDLHSASFKRIDGMVSSPKGILPLSKKPAEPMGRSCPDFLEIDFRPPAPPASDDIDFRPPASLPGAR